MDDKQRVEEAAKLLADLADGRDNSDLEQHERDAIGWALSYAMENCVHLNPEAVGTRVPLREWAVDEMKGLLDSSFRPIEYTYEKLSAVERGVLSKGSFEEIVGWLKGERG